MVKLEGGKGLNKGKEDLMDSHQECREFCELNYPEAKFFTYNTNTSANVEGRRSCWCKETNQGRQEGSGAISGNVGCADGK